MKGILIVAMLFVSTLAFSQSKIIEGGGAGSYKAIAITDASFPGYTIYRPQNLQSVVSETNLPLIVFANGGCTNSNLPFENYLNEIASFGYVIVAVGPLHLSVDEMMNDTDSRTQMPPAMLIEAINIMEKCNEDPSSEFYHKMDMSSIAVMGQSCGGVQAIAVSSDPRITTTICLNSGVINNREGTDSKFASSLLATKDDLRKIHSPILYVIGGESDIAYPNAMDDYSRLNNVFVSMASFDVGHGGTYSERYGGSFASITLQWLEWHLKNKPWMGSIFNGEECICQYPGWSVIFKNEQYLKK